MKLSTFCMTLFLLGMAVMIVCVLGKTDGHFVYALDDPYIHLALAEQLAHGHYGINAGEAASPSSSILWPFLLLPFADTKFHVYVPLAWNILFGTLAAGLIGSIVARWPLSRTDGEAPALSWKHYLVAALLLFTANLFSLSIIGMEHVLQVLLAICCAYGVIEAAHDRPIPTWCLAAAAIAPMIRYEDLALTIAVCFAYAGLGRWKTSLVLFCTSLVPLFAFSLFLRSRGLPLLPMSVLVKADAYSNSGGAAHAWALLRTNLRADFQRPDQWSTVLLTIFFLFLTISARKKLHRAVYAGVSLLGILQLTVGRFGWFHRYEDYAVIFLVLVALSAATELYRPHIAIVTATILCLSVYYIHATRMTPASSRVIFLQQYQMHRFVTEYYTGNYAVNDVGLTSFDRRSGAYVLDLYGLASIEAARQTHKDAQWMRAIVDRHHVNLVMIYPSWFKGPKPDEWKPIGSLCELAHDRVLIGEPCVVFYSTSRESDDAIRNGLARFSQTLPRLTTYLPL